MGSLHVTNQEIFAKDMSSVLGSALAMLEQFASSAAKIKEEDMRRHSSQTDKKT